jgi:hypothetical protein
VVEPGLQTREMNLTFFSLRGLHDAKCGKLKAEL